MSYANGTPFLNLAQTVGLDHRDWFDENEAKLDLDTKMKTLWDGAASTADILEQLQETVSGLDTDLASLTTIVDGHTTTLQTVNESLVLINSALSALNTDVHTKFDSAGIADPYDPTYGTYSVGNIVTYNGQRYKCITAVTAAEPFDADKWLAEDVQTVINDIKNDLAIDPITYGLYYQHDHLMGNIKLVNNNSQITAADTWCTFATLDSKYRPSVNINVPAIGYKQDGITQVPNCGIRIQTDGTVQAHASATDVWNINAVILPSIS